MKCTECSKVVKPVVVLDIDGTLGEYHGHYHRFAEGYLGRELRPGYDGSCELHEWYGISLELYRTIKLAYRQGGMKRTMPVYEGASDLTLGLRDRGVEIWMATTRPFQRLDNIDPDTRWWLDRNGIVYDGLVYGDDKYHRVLDNVGLDRVVAVLDDLPENVRGAEALGLPAYLRTNAHNRSAEGLLRVSDCADFALLCVPRLARWKEEHAHRDHS